MTAEEYYQKGNEYRKQSQWHEAINCYIQAIELDPDSPAVEAKRMLDDIMAFYCKDRERRGNTHRLDRAERRTRRGRLPQGTHHRDLRSGVVR